jgi:hypothetical protein
MLEGSKEDRGSHVETPFAISGTAVLLTPAARGAPGAGSVVAAEESVTAKKAAARVGEGEGARARDVKGAG